MSEAIYYCCWTSLIYRDKRRSSLCGRDLHTSQYYNSACWDTGQPCQALGSIPRLWRTNFYIWNFRRCTSALVRLRILRTSSYGLDGNSDGVGVIIDCSVRIAELVADKDAVDTTDTCWNNGLSLHFYGVLLFCCHWRIRCWQLIIHHLPRERICLVGTLRICTTPTRLAVVRRRTDRPAYHNITTAAANSFLSDLFCR